MSEFKKTYDERKAQGLCVRCGGAEATHGVHCFNCKNDRDNRRKKQTQGDKEPNYNCYWYRALQRSCGALNCLVCTSGKCSFYETAEEFKERQKKYNNEIGNQIQIINDLAKIKGWTAKQTADRRQRLCNLELDKRKAYIDKLVAEV